jgi:putative ABC transport system permease protein
MWIERWILAMRAKARALFGREAMDRELDEELRYHVERKTAENIARGMSAAEARRLALLDAGGVEQAKEECRDARGVSWIQNLELDVQFGLRMLRKNPGFMAVAMLTLALGIGANTAIFSVVSAVLLRPIPYPEPSRIVQFQLQMKQGNLTDALTVPEFEYFRDHNDVFESIAASRPGPDASLKHDNSVEWVSTVGVTDDFFRALGVEPVMGREFTREETGPNGAPSAILSERVWRQMFGGDPQILGREIDMDGRSYAVVGVMPRDFRFIEGPADVFTPLALGTTLGDRGMNTEVLARMSANETLRQAQANIDVAYQQFHAQDAERQSDTGVQLTSYQDWLVSDIKPSLLMLLGAVGFLLMVACANIASLFLARSNARQGEVSIRLALGARRGRLLQQFLTESLLMAVPGGVAGLLLGTLGLKALTASIPFFLPAGVRITLDLRVLAFTLALTIATSLVFGAASFWQASKLDLNSALKDSTKGTANATRHRAGKVLVAAEVALSAAMLVGATLLIESLYHLRSQALGFDPTNVVTMTTPFTAPKGTTRAALWNSQQQILQRIQALPGVESAAIVSRPPLVGGGNFPAQREGYPSKSMGAMEIRSVSDEYFQTMRIPLLNGRNFNATDSVGSTRTALISGRVARQWWNGENPIGDHIVLGMMGGKLYTQTGQTVEIVGVVGDVKGKTIGAPAPPTLYMPVSQVVSDGSNPPAGWVVRTQDNVNIAAELRAAVAAVNPEQRVMLLMTMEQVIGQQVSGQNFDALLMGLFAALALALTAVGIYGVLSFQVAQRTREIGVRVALGASGSDVLRLIVGQGMTLTWVGIAAGIGGSLVLTRFLASLLFEVKPTDLLTYVVVTIALSCVALAACWIPARRAMRVDPMVALRHE